MLPKLGKLHLNEITRQVVQDFLFEFTNVGKNRTAQKLKQMLHAIFDVAREDYNLKSPMTKIVLSHYEVKKGHALTKDEERQLVEYCKSNTRYAGNSALLILLYTGMRVGELKSIENDDCYITCVSEKTRKGRKDVIRKIPISPMLRRVMHLVDFDEAKTISREAVRSLLKRIFPDKYTHELRYSFITRAKECGCNPEVVMKWVEHEYDADVKSSKVDRGYTDYSQEYMLKEINKIDYIL